MNRVIPFDQIEGRSFQGRELLVKRYFPRFKKSQIVAYTFWFLLGTIGAHRFYLKQWKVGLGIASFWLLVPVLTLYFISKLYSGNSEMLRLIPEVFRYMFLGFILVEGVFLFSNVRQFNSGLLMKLRMEANLDD